MLTADRSLLEHAFLDAFNPVSHLLDAKRIAANFGLSLPELAKVLERDASGLRRRPDAESLQAALRPFYEVLRRLDHLFVHKSKNVRIWLHAPHPEFEGKRPIDYVREGRFIPLESLITAMELRQGG